MNINGDPATRKRNLVDIFSWRITMRPPRRNFPPAAGAGRMNMRSVRGGC